MSESITLLLHDWASGSNAARNELMPLVYQDLKVLSRRILKRESSRHVTATALVHDLFIKLVNHHSMTWNDRHHFFSFCAHLMRQILTDLARARLTQKRRAMVELAGHDELPWVGQNPADFLDLNLALERLAEEDSEKSRVVELRIYLGCTAEETAEILGISKATVDRHMMFSKAWLFKQLRPGAS